MKQKSWTKFDLVLIGIAMLMLLALNVFSKPDVFDAIALMSGFLLGMGLGGGK